jgi:hypothetical protein
MRFRKNSGFKILKDVYEIFNGNFEFDLCVEFSALISYF